MLDGWMSSALECARHCAFDTWLARVPTIHISLQIQQFVTINVYM